MPAGAPPKTFSNEEVHELGVSLLTWLNGEGRGNIQFVRWYFLEHGMTKEDWKNLKKRDQFRPYYEIALSFITENVILNKDIPQSYGNRYLCYYDHDLLEHEEALKDRDAQRGKEVKQTVNVEQLNTLAACLERFSQRKAPSSNIEVSVDHSEISPEKEHAPVASPNP